MPMHIFALSIVIIEYMGGFKSENFSNSYHFAKITIFGNVGVSFGLVNEIASS